MDHTAPGPGIGAGEPFDSSDLRTAANLVALLRLRGIGPRGAVEIASSLRTRELIEQLSPEDLRRRVGKRLAEALSTQSLGSGEVVLPDGAWTLGYFDAAYPKAFRELNDPPAVIWGIGTPPSQQAIAVIGTRHPTAWAGTTAQAVAASAVDHALDVVSGLAIGIDTVAHTACLVAGGRTTAVLGTGIDIQYPAENRGLATRIVDEGGCLLSEVPPGTRPSPKTLVARDRLQAALSLATVVIQSGIPGGTLHTARFTVEQGKPLVVVKPREGADPKAYAGNVALVDPNGCDPDHLKASGALAVDLKNKKPVADVVLTASEQLPEVWQTARAWDPGEGLRKWRRQGGIKRSSSTSTEPSPTLPL